MARLAGGRIDAVVLGFHVHPGKAANRVHCFLAKRREAFRCRQMEAAQPPGDIIRMREVAGGHARMGCRERLEG